MKILGLDCSINHLGWGGIDTTNEQPKLVDSGVIMCNSSQGNDRYRIIAQELDKIMAEMTPDLCAIEWPTFENSARGRDLVKKKGLTKLCAVAGECAAVAAVRDIPYTPITAWQWKGSYPKPKIKQRVEKILGERDWQREDEWEALGLALWAWKNEGGYEVY